MGMLRRALGALGFGPEPAVDKYRLDYKHMMTVALLKIRMAELQIREATCLEDLDIGRAALQTGWAEVQQLVRAAKRERGIAVRPIAETEEQHLRLRDHLNHRDPAKGRHDSTAAARMRSAK